MSSLIKSRRYWFSFLPAVLALLLLVTCTNDEQSTTAPSQAPLSSSPAMHSGCKSFVTSLSSEGGLGTQDCIEFSYDGSDILHIKHTNAAFNCCPDTIYIEADRDNHTITLVEKEDLTGGGCLCLCLYDLEYSISGIAPHDYTIRVAEPYLMMAQDDTELQLSVDLTETSTGSFCVARGAYPWNDDSVLTGTVASLDGCRPLPGPSAKGTSAAQNCLAYSYDGVGTLTINHTNAVFNCCADSSSVSVSLNGNMLQVEEYEHYVVQSPCRCFCPFDLSYEITGLAPGVYMFKVIGPEAPTYDDTLSCLLDLTVASGGACCFDGPW